MSSKKLLCLKDFEQYAKKHLNKMALGYYNSGANHEHTLADNENDFLKLKIKPKFLDNDLSKINLATKILGKHVDFPIGISPTAMQKLAHPDGEIGTVKACEKQNTIFILSTIATSSIAEVAAASPNARKWFQLYVYKDRNLTEKLIKNAEKHNFEALVLTIDAPVFGTRYADIHNNFHLPDHLRMANFDSGNLESDSIKMKRSGNSGITEYVKEQFDPSLTWDVLDWLKKKTKLKIILKGVLTADTALKAVEHNVDAIIVSNHGGRQLDTTPSSIMALPEIASAVKDKTEIYLDCGVRNGIDALKAISLGAKGVFVGRAALWGLCHSGSDGVNSILEILKNELEMALKLSGCNDVNKLDKSYLTTKREYIRKLESYLKE